jgi:acetylornithine deacetylase
METRIVDILSRLVKINSVNSTLSAGMGEKRLAEFIHEFLKKLRLDAKIQTAAANRPNVVAVIPGNDRSRSLMLNGHLDTVGVEGMEDPFTLRREKDRLFGRGAYDMKGSLAVMLALAEYFAEQPPPLDLLLTFVSDEEDKSVGTEHLVEKWLPRISPPPVGAIFLEPTEENIGVCHKGFIWYELEIVGKAAHGSRPEQGVDAIAPLRAALEEMSRIQEELTNRTAHPLLGHASIHSSIIGGGGELSVIPAISRLQWERRTLPGESRHDLQNELKRMIQAVENHPGNHAVNGRQIFLRPPYSIPENAHVLVCLQKMAPQSRPVGLSFWADSALAGIAGVPSVLFGPVGHGAHAVDEWVSLKSLVRVHDVLKNLIGSV